VADGGARRPGVDWLLAALACLLAGLALVAVLVAAVPSRIVIPVGRPGGLVPQMLIGVHAPEKNYDHWMRWTTGHARVRWPGRFGASPEAVVVTVAGFPGRQGDQVEVGINGVASRHRLTDAYQDIRVAVPKGVVAPLDVSLTSPFTRAPGGDERTLGVRLEAVTIENRGLVARLTSVQAPAGIVALGALAWAIGAWAAGEGASRRRRLLSAVAAWCVAAAAAVVIAPTALRADTWLTLGSVALGVAATWLLGRRGGDRVAAAVGGLLFTVAGLVLTTWCVSSFVDVPRWDIWDFVTFLQKREARGLTLADFLAPHNEHRPTVIRLVLLANVLLSGWNHWNELWVMLALAGAHLLVLAALVARESRGQALATVILLAGIAVFVPSPTQWENWLHGWQIALVAGATAMTAALGLLTARDLTWPRVALAAGFVIAGTASFGSCLLAWPIGVAAIALRRQPGWLVKAAAWGALGVVIGLAYVHGLVRPPQLPPPAPILTSPTAFMQVAFGTCLALGMPVWYALTTLSQPDGPASWLVPSIGLAGLTLGLVLILAHLMRAETRRAQAWLLPALLMAFAAGACALTAIGRVPLGVHAMTASRYIVFTMLFWVGLLWLLTIASPFRSRAMRSAGLALAAVIVAAGVRAWGDALPSMEQHYVSGVRGREALLRIDWAKTGDIFPVPPVLDERRQWLLRHRLSVYRPGAR
jgi:hypothetical protein